TLEHRGQGQTMALAERSKIRGERVRQDRAALVERRLLRCLGGEIPCREVRWQPRAGREAGERPAPELTSVRGLLSREPRDELPVRDGARETRLPPSEPRAVAGHGLVEDERWGPGVEQHVMEGPEELPLRVAGPNESEAHQGRTGRIEAAGAVLMEGLL